MGIIGKITYLRTWNMAKSLNGSSGVPGVQGGAGFEGGVSGEKLGGPGEGLKNVERTKSVEAGRRGGEVKAPGEKGRREYIPHPVCRPSINIAHNIYIYSLSSSSCTVSYDVALSHTVPWLY